MSYKKINNVKKRDGDSYYMYIEFINLKIYNSLIDPRIFFNDSSRFRSNTKALMESVIASAIDEVIVC